MAVVYGFAGYRWRTGEAEFSPILPTRAGRLRFPLLLRGSLLEVDIEEQQVTYRVRSGDPVTARHYGKRFTVSAGSPMSFSGYYRTRDGLVPRSPAPQA
jgi:alpha,alpha-trehalose phosphorylase